jgi:hypothetical protein
VTGHQQVGDRNARNAATNAVSIENRLTEKLLTASNTYGRLGLGRTRGRRQPSTRLKANPVGLEEINFTLIVLREQVMKQLFACWCEGGEIVVKLIPHHPVLLGSAFETFDAAPPLHRIERGEITQLHRKAVWRPPHPVRDLNDYGIEVVELSKWQLAIQIERYQQVLARPFYARGLGHGGSLPQIPNSVKREMLSEDLPD